MTSPGSRSTRSSCEPVKCDRCLAVVYGLSLELGGCMATTNGSLISVEDVTVRFGGVIAVNRASMAVPAGEIRGLIGPNGPARPPVRHDHRHAATIGGHRFLRRRRHHEAKCGVAQSQRHPAHVPRQQPFGLVDRRGQLPGRARLSRRRRGLMADIVAFPARKKIESERRERPVRRSSNVAWATSRASRPGACDRQVRLLELAGRSSTARGPCCSMSPLRLEEQSRIGSRRSFVFPRHHRRGGVLVEHDVPFVMNLSVESRCSIWAK